VSHLDLHACRAWPGVRPGGPPKAEPGALTPGQRRGRRRLVHALEERKEQQDKERITAGSLWRGSPCVFTTPIGTPVDPRNDYREFKKLLCKAGLPSVRLHDLRHTAAGLLVAQGVPARVVMEILGHSQIALTMNTYSHVAPEVSREAADRMAKTLWQDDEDQADKDQADEPGAEPDHEQEDDK
jgi:integrase